MNALANAGQMTNQRYIDLTYIVAEQEDEEEQRNYSAISKITKPVLPHSSYSCIGNPSCLKQKNIRKLFPLTLKQCEELNQVNVASAKALTSEENPEGNSPLKNG